MGESATKPYATTRSMGMLTLLSLLGPLSGLAVEMALAWRYGASATVDAYRIAMLLIVVGYQLFFSNLLPHVVIPMFTEYRAKNSELEGWRLAFTLAVILGFGSLVFIGWVWLKPEQLVALLGPGLSPSGWADAEFLLRYFSLALLLMAWAGIASSMLNVYRIFWILPVAQLLPNLFVIMAMLWVGGAVPVETLAFGLLFGYVAMFGLFAYGLNYVRMSINIRINDLFKFSAHEGLKKAMRLSIPLLFGVCVGQWGIIVINRVMSELPPGTLAEFGYAWKLLALVGLLPAGLATVIFPMHMPMVKRASFLAWQNVPCA